MTLKITTFRNHESTEMNDTLTQEQLNYYQELIEDVLESIRQAICAGEDRLWHGIDELSNGNCSQVRRDQSHSHLSPQIRSLHVDPSLNP